MKNPYAFRPNTLYLGDCLEVMNAFVEAGQQVDLIYLDPPFNSDVDHSMLFKQDTQGRDLDEQAQFIAFQDTWYWTPTAAERVENLKNATANPAHKVMVALDTMIPQTPMLAYLSYMAERLFVMHRLLKDTGSLYLHCDPTANSYLRIILDAIFGTNNYRNEIVWCYTGPSAAKKNFPAKHDVILRYTKSEVWVFNANEVRIPYKALHSDKGKGAKFWGDKGKLQDEETRRRYEARGKVPEDFWLDIPSGGHISPSERLGYPTQKPRALLERIIKASSNEGDIVLDPFAGCGTTAEASFRLGRKFLGIDISAYALRQICTARLKDAAGVEVLGLPTDMASATVLAGEKPFVFEQWAVTSIPGMVPNDKQTGDGGVDGRGTLLYKPTTDGEPERGLVFAQVKGGKSITPDSYRALLSKIAGGKASVGLFITLKKQKPTPSMKKAISDAGTYTLPGGTRKRQRLIFWSIAEYFDDGKKSPRDLPELAHPFTGKAMPRQIALTQKA